MIKDCDDLPGDWQSSPSRVTALSQSLVISLIKLMICYVMERGNPLRNSTCSQAIFWPLPLCNDLHRGKSKLHCIGVLDTSITLTQFQHNIIYYDPV